MDSFDTTDEAGTPEQQAALAAALRRQQTLGLIAQLSGDKVLSPVGNSLLESSDRGQQRLELGKQRRQQLQLEAKKDSETRAYQQQEVGLQQQGLDLRRSEAATERGRPFQAVDPSTGAVQLFRMDKRGTPVPLNLGAPPKPAPGGAGAVGGQKDWEKFGAAINTGARGSLSKDLQKSINAGEALETLLQLPSGALINATPQQMREATSALAGLIAKGGSQSLGQIEELSTPTLAGKIANLKQYVTGNPQGQDTPGLVENILDTAKREMQTAHKQLRRQQLQGVPNYIHLRKADPKRFDTLLQNSGLDPASIDEAGAEIPQAAPVASADKPARKAARIQELIKGGERDAKKIHDTLKAEGLL